MRPRGEVREALAQACTTLAPAGGGTWRDMAAAAQVGYGKAKATVRDMVRAGELLPAGRVHEPHARRPMCRYVPARPGQPGRRTVDAGAALARAWVHAY